MPSTKQYIVPDKTYLLPFFQLSNISSPVYHNGRKLVSRNYCLYMRDGEYVEALNYSKRLHKLQSGYNNICSYILQPRNV